MYGNASARAVLENNGIYVYETVDCVSVFLSFFLSCCSSMDGHTVKLLEDMLLCKITRE